MAAALDAELAGTRAEAVAYLDLLMGGILANGLVLLDPALGTPTTWGKWDPATVNGDRAFSDGRGLNSAQILAWLRAAARLAGNATYDAAADDLKAAHG